MCGQSKVKCHKPLQSHIVHEKHTLRVLDFNLTVINSGGCFVFLRSLSDAFFGQDEPDMCHYFLPLNLLWKKIGILANFRCVHLFSFLDCLIIWMWRMVDIHLVHGLLDKCLWLRPSSFVILKLLKNNWNWCDRIKSYLHIKFFQLIVQPYKKVAYALFPFYSLGQN